MLYEQNVLFSRTSTFFLSQQRKLNMVGRFPNIGIPFINDPFPVCCRIIHEIQLLIKCDEGQFIAARIQKSLNLKFKNLIIVSLAIISAVNQQLQHKFCRYFVDSWNI